MVTKDMVRTYKGPQKMKLATAVGVYKCLKQIMLPISHHKCTPISELPSNMSSVTFGIEIYKHTNA